MSDHPLQPAIDFLVNEINEALSQVAQKQKLANQLAASAGLDPVYQEIEEPTQGQVGAIRSDQFANYNAPSTAARAFLEWRGKKRGSVEINAIYDALVAGGFAFGSNNVSESKNGLRIALGKDAQVKRLPNGTFGLVDWYPNARKEKGRKSPDDTADADSADAEEELGDEESGSKQASASDAGK